MKALLISGLALVAACGAGPRRLPTEPTAPTVNGSGLKAPAPALLSPQDFAEIATNSALVLRVGDVRGTYASFTPSYEVELWNPAGTFRYQSTFPGSLFRIMPLVEVDVPLLWRVRATHEGHVGPWSSQRTLRVRRTAHIVGAGDTIERGHQTLLSVRIRQQGDDADCPGPAAWSSDRPDIASVTQSGLVTPHRLGVVSLTARCEAASETRVFSVAETWRADVRFKSCNLVLGTGRSCWSTQMEDGDAGTVRLELTESGSVVAGELSMPGISGIPFSGTIAPDNRLSGSGRKVTCGENGMHLHVLEVVNDRLDLRIRETDGLGCVLPASFHREWQVVADMGRLQR